MTEIHIYISDTQASPSKIRTTVVARTIRGWFGKYPQQKVLIAWLYSAETRCEGYASSAN